MWGLVVCWSTDGRIVANIVLKK